MGFEGAFLDQAALSGSHLKRKRPTVSSWTGWFLSVRLLPPWLDDLICLFMRLLVELGVGNTNCKTWLIDTYSE